MKRKYVIIGAVVIVVAGGLFFASSSLNKPTIKKPTLNAATPESRNELRKIALKQISTGLNNYIAEKGALPIQVSTVPKDICSSISAKCTKAKLIDLNFLSSNGVYIASIPSDPVGVHSQYSTGFTLSKDPTSGKIVVSAPNAELGAVLSASTR